MVFAVVAATIVDVVQPRQLVDVLVLAYKTEIDEFVREDEAAVLSGIAVTMAELVVLVYDAGTDEFETVDDTAVLRGIEEVITVVVLVKTDAVAELVTFCIVVLAIDEVEFENMTLVVLAAAGSIVELVVF